MKLYFTVFGEPKGKGRPRFGGGRTYTPETTRAYERQVLAEFRRCYPGTAPIQAGVPIRVRIMAFFKVAQRDSRTTKLEKLNGLIRPTKAPDWDNIGKIICDALNGAAWEDDAQVVEASVQKRYGSEPMVCVTIEEDE